jgi:hypothetical protein
MSFEDFRKSIENNLKSIAKIELQEYHFEPYNFGSGILGLRINGRIHKFVFDGKENELTWLASKPHEKYYGAELTEIKRINSLELSIVELKSEI